MSLRSSYILRRRRLSLTSLIDIIFLLLMFFMLSSTFTRYVEVPLFVAQTAAAGEIDATDVAPTTAFLRLGTSSLSLNGQSTALPEALGMIAEQEAPRAVIVSVAQGVTTQRLTDTLAALLGLEGLSVTVLD